MEKCFPGLNVQFPISQLIHTGAKSIETRTYRLPKKYEGVEILLVETPGKSESFRARAIGILVFSGSFKYSSKKEFEGDKEKHGVDNDSQWAWTPKGKWGWTIHSYKKLSSPVTLKCKRGIVFTKSIKI